MTKEIERRLAKYPLCSQDGNELKKVLVKFFNPYGLGTWQVTEAERQSDGDYLFFGHVTIHDGEWGYFRLSDIQKLWANVFGVHMPMERDYYEYNYYINDDGVRV